MNLDLLITFTVIVVILMGFALFANFRHVQEDKRRAANFKRAEMERRAKSAVWTGATIITVRPHTTAEEMRESVRVDLTLEVTPSLGEPYTARTSWRVALPLLAQFQPGAPLSVKIDPNDPDLIFPNQPGAEYWA